MEDSVLHAVCVPRVYFQAICFIQFFATSGVLPGARGERHVGALALATAILPRPGEGCVQRPTRHHLASRISNQIPGHVTSHAAVPQAARHQRTWPTTALTPPCLVGGGLLLCWYKSWRHVVPWRKHRSERKTRHSGALRRLVVTSAALQVARIRPRSLHSWACCALVRTLCPRSWFCTSLREEGTLHLAPGSVILSKSL